MVPQQGRRWRQTYPSEPDKEAGADAATGLREVLREGQQVVAWVERHACGHTHAVGDGAEEPSIGTPATLLRAIASSADEARAADGADGTAEKRLRGLLEWILPAREGDGDHAVVDCALWAVGDDAARGRLISLYRQVSK